MIATTPLYMTRLIEIARRQMRGLSADTTMKFVLSALWNLTDESPRACHCFYRHQGIDMAVECLKVRVTTCGLDSITHCSYKYIIFVTFIMRRSATL